MGNKITSACRIIIYKTLKQMDGTGSGSCAVAGFGINGVEHSGSAMRVS